MAPPLTPSHLALGVRYLPLHLGSQRALEAKPSLRAPAPSLQVKRPGRRRPALLNHFHQRRLLPQPRLPRLLYSHLQQRRRRTLCLYQSRWLTPLRLCSGRRNLCTCCSGTSISCLKARIGPQRAPLQTRASCDLSPGKVRLNQVQDPDWDQPLFLTRALR